MTVVYDHNAKSIRLPRERVPLRIHDVESVRGCGKNPHRRRAKASNDKCSLHSDRRVHKIGLMHVPRQSHEVEDARPEVRVDVRRFVVQCKDRAEAVGRSRWAPISRDDEGIGCCAVPGRQLGPQRKCPAGLVCVIDR